MRRTFLPEDEPFDIYHGHPIDPQLYFALDLWSDVSTDDQANWPTVGVTNCVQLHPLRHSPPDPRFKSPSAQTYRYTVVTICLRVRYRKEGFLISFVQWRIYIKLPKAILPIPTDG